MGAELNAPSDAPPGTRPTLSGWMIRDLLIMILAIILLMTLQEVYQAYPYWWSAAPVCLIAFSVCFSLCYIVHEWGHYLGAKWSGIDMPLAPYKGVTLGLFHIDDYSRRQYLWLSWGGDIGHLVVTLCAGFIYLQFPNLVSTAFLVGGIAFTVQALSVDQPIIWQVTRGANILEAAEAGTTSGIILKRTWQSWLAAALFFFGVYFFT